jgi:uncharacterized protein
MCELMNGLLTGGFDVSAKAVSSNSIAGRVDTLDWSKIEKDLSENGFALTSPVLSGAECDSLIEIFARDSIYRKVVDMARHGFGRGVYKYFSYPLPPLVQELRESIYPHLVETANEWSKALRTSQVYPATLKKYLDICKAAGQLRPTPLLLRYEPGDFNCLHQDKYGEAAFPMQIAIFLSEPGVDFTGGEFVMVEQIPRAQSKASVLLPRQGQMVIFTNQDHPVKSKRGYYRAKMRHGVSALHSGMRYTLGIIFHDAE